MKTMTKIICVLLLCFFTFSCKKSSDDQPTPTNQAPTTPSNPTPADGAIDISLSPILSWSCIDPDGDSVKYELYLSNVNPPNTLIASNLFTASYAVSGLDSNKIYYWRVNAKDSKGSATAGPIWHFKTITNSIPSQGLVAYYPFNGNANDESSNGNNGTVNGPTLTTDRFNHPNMAYNFVGNDMNNIAITPFILPQIISISIWFYPTTNGPGGDQRSVLLSNQQMYVNHDAMSIWMENGAIHFGFINTAGNGFEILSNSTINLNQWHHVVCIIDQDKLIKIYLDNVYQNQTISWSGAYSGQNVTNIGNCYLDNDNFDGFIDDLRIYDRALSVPEIQALYHENGWTK